MRHLVACCCAAALTGCAKSEPKPASDTAEAAPAAPAAATISLGDVAGKWNVRTMAESGDSTLISFELVVSGDKSDWTEHFPNRDPIAVRVVAVDGDSIVTEAGPFESVLRKGVQVTTRSVNRLVDGKLVGATVARYATTGPDSVRHLRFEGTRAP